jgi:hypothetical protein
VQRGVFEKVTAASLRVYVIWVPMFRGHERDVPNASREVPDQRALHYWDGHSSSMRAVRASLGLSEDAWDVFLLYPPGVTWDGTSPPEPEFWMHQLGSRTKPRVDGPYLDPAVFLERTRTLLERP